MLLNFGKCKCLQTCHGSTSIQSNTVEANRAYITFFIEIVFGMHFTKYKNKIKNNKLNELLKKKSNMQCRPSACKKQIRI